MILVGIDIGTNAIRLLIADIGASSYRELASARIITRLGQDLDRTGLLSPEAQERSLSALLEFARTASSFPGALISAVGTSAVRNAKNRDEFAQTLRQRTGLELRVISGDEEARLTLLGVRRALSRAGREQADPLGSALVLDIGGGSTELISTRGGAAAHAQSLPLGAVYLTERHIRTDPPSFSGLDEVRAAVRQELDAWELAFVRSEGIPPKDLAALAGTAGTITTLAAMDLELRCYDPGRINGHVLARASLDRLVRYLSAATLEQRRRLPGLEPGREDIILAGAVICQEIMERCAKRDLLVSDWGLREGIVLDLYERSLPQSA